MLCEYNQYLSSLAGYRLAGKLIDGNGPGRRWEAAAFSA
jgi:hypothetical protein